LIGFWFLFRFFNSILFAGVEAYGKCVWVRRILCDLQLCFSFVDGFLCMNVKRKKKINY